MNLKEIRNYHSFSQQTMALLLNIPRSTYSMIETNKRKPSKALEIKIKELFDVDSAAKHSKKQAELLVTKLKERKS